MYVYISGTAKWGGGGGVCVCVCVCVGGGGGVGEMWALAVVATQ